jgi:inosine/xanthosine triphosphate pyrophosphatase family protein
MQMGRNNRYIYDGWIPIKEWSKEDVRKAIRNIDEALSIFCLSSRIFFEWEPKYPSLSGFPSIYHFENKEIAELEMLSKVIDSLKEEDRTALYRSIAWLSQSLCLKEPAARFLFLILAIESLARYIEDEAYEDSPFLILREKSLTKKEKREKRENCINDILLEKLQDNKTEAIKKAYFDCVIGIKRQIKNHMDFVFSPDSGPADLLFEDRVDGCSLYDLRSIIAHGTIDALSEVQREQIERRISDAENIARKYILIVLKKSIGFETPDGATRGSFFLKLEN